MKKIRIMLTFTYFFALITGVFAQAKDANELQELMNKIRREKFDVTLPQIMKEHNIDMWIHVLREGNPDPLSSNLGSESGVFIFTDRGEAGSSERFLVTLQI